MIRALRALIHFKSAYIRNKRNASWNASIPDYLRIQETACTLWALASFGRSLISCLLMNTQEYKKALGSKLPGPSIFLRIRK